MSKSTIFTSAFKCPELHIVTVRAERGKSTLQFLGSSPPVALHCTTSSPCCSELLVLKVQTISTKSSVSDMILKQGHVIQNIAQLSQRSLPSQ